MLFLLFFQDIVVTKPIRMNVDKLTCGNEFFNTSLKVGSHMPVDKEQELKQLYLHRLKSMGYHTIPELIEILPPTIMNVIGSTISIAEQLFMAAIKSHMLLVQKEFHGDPPQGINKALTTMGYMTIQELAEANPTIIAKALKISLDNAGELALYAMELSVKQDDFIVASDELIDDLDKEIGHYLGQLERLEQDQKLKEIVDISVQKIHDTIKFPSAEFAISQEQKKGIQQIIQQFMTVFPACTGFAIYNKRGEGVYSFSNDTHAKQTLEIIHESISSLIWKISLSLEERDEYGWISAQKHLVWIEALRNRKSKRQLAYIGLFVFESEARKGVGTATPTIKGIIKEIERIVYEIKE